MCCPGSVKNAISILTGVALVILATLLLQSKSTMDLLGICVVFSFFHQHPTVFKVQVFCLLTLVYP